MKYRATIFFFAAFLSFVSRAQTIPELVVRYVDELKANQPTQIPVELLKEENANVVLFRSEPHLKDSLVSVRSGILLLMSKIGVTVKNEELRKHIVFQIITATDDGDAGLAGNALHALTEFRKQDFEVRAKNLLINKFVHQPVHVDQFIKLMGYLDLKVMTEKVRPYTLPPHDKRDRWAALVALARLGDSLAIQSVIQRIQKLKISDDVIYEVFPDLVYTRQPAAINYMITILNSDEKNCLSPNPNSNMPIPCGYRVMEQLAPIIEGYPLKLGPGGDIETTDYTKALQQVRQWFKERGTNYTIRKDTF